MDVMNIKIIKFGSMFYRWMYWISEL